MKPGNRYMRPESTETHFGYLSHFSGIHFFYPLAAEAKLADKAQHFYGHFFCCCGRFVLSCLVLFAFPIKSTNTEEKNGIHNKMFEFF